MFLFELKFDVLLSSQLALNMTALNIQDFCHELRFTLGQIEPLLGEFEALRLVVVAQLAQRKVNLLEVVCVRVVDALLLHLLDFSEELDKHLLCTFLASLLVLSTQFFGPHLENLLKLGEAFRSDLRIAHQIPL